MRNILWSCILLASVAGCARNTGETLPLITPTVYYKPVIDKSKMKCSSNELRDLVDENGKILISLCAKEYDNCLLQGSCFVIEDGKTRAFNFTKKKDGANRFAEKRESRCPYGYGVKAICLDPFYSVAADPAFHKAGDVIFVPQLVGLMLPDGSLHNGYLIVRDEGGAIIGENRFDFFTGFYGPYDRANSFSRAGLSDKKNRFGYQEITGEVAQSIRDSRNYPNIPGDFEGPGLTFTAATVKLFP
jgi:3D (Asp-Asp-Asp) domain-containing protein